MRRDLIRAGVLLLCLTLVGALVAAPVGAKPLSAPVLGESTARGGNEVAPGITADWWSTVQENIRASEYHFGWQEETYLPELLSAFQAPNRAHNLRTYLTSDGPMIIPRVGSSVGGAPSWQLSLHLTAWGREGSLQDLSSAAPQPEGNLVEYHRPGLTERYINDEAGLHQHIILAGAPVSDQRGQDGLVEIQLSFPGDLTPQLTGDGVQFATAEGEVALQYIVLGAADADGRRLDLQLVPGATGFALLVEDASASYPITIMAGITGLSLTSDWDAEGDQAEAFFGESVRTAGDVNGDGYADVIVGAPYFDNVQDDEGRAFVYHGSADGLGTTPTWVGESNQASAWYGNSVSMAGDLNNDGYGDIVIGAPHWSFSEAEEGAVYVYLGSNAGIDSATYQIRQSDVISAHLGFSVGAAGDVDNDGYDDIIVGAPDLTDDQDNEGRVYVYYGGPGGLSADAPWTADSDQVGARLGRSVGPAGDVNGDGYADVIAGAPRYDNRTVSETGRAYVFHGSDSGPSATYDWHVLGDHLQSHLGSSVYTAGDVNGDGYSDVIVGEPGYTNGQTDEGRALVFYGSNVDGLSLTHDWSVEGDNSVAHLGSSVSTAGDVNGDFYADVIVGAYRYANPDTGEGAVFLYHGSSGGLNTTFNWVSESNQESAQLGWAVATAGDVNGDGYSDVIVAADKYDSGDTDEGVVYVYHGGPDGLSFAEGWSAEANQEDAQFGYEVNTAGDVDGDGYADVIVGAPVYDGGGRAYLYYGSSSGLQTVSTTFVDSGQSGARLGSSVGAAGDVNGDGYGDVIIGADHYSNGVGEFNEGRVYLYYGSDAGLSLISPWVVEINLADARLGASVGTAGDVNGDGYADVIVGAPNYYITYGGEGRVFVYHGSADGPSSVPDWSFSIAGEEANFGHDVATAGDINGDGYSDVVIGSPGYDEPEPFDLEEGAAWIFLGSRDGLHGLHRSIQGDQQAAWLGKSVGAAGDVNGDGYGDVIVGAPGYDVSPGGTEGRAYVYYGSESGLIGAQVDWIDGDLNNGQVGKSVSTAGDVNGDGFADVVVGAYLYDGDGRAFVYHGSAGGLSETSNWEATGGQSSSQYGWSVASAGDVNGDGFAEVIVGARYYGSSVDHDHEGRAYLYYGGGGQGFPLRPRQRQNDSLTPIAPLGMIFDDRSVQLCLHRWMPVGKEKVDVQWQVAPLGASFDDPSTITDQVGSWMNTGSALCAAVHDLPAGPLHWRIRLLHRPNNLLGLSVSRWVHVPWNGWGETDLRTPWYEIYLPAVLRGS